ncbi:hypothetical protein M408DRAFT_325778 [Serendipita vermifera MAFF 305830]|uniref:Uncharacterized protein n=1 Tax=Serendipita vermifera MAFF 305830 TaxID=933852 RepID=A0A0C3BBZ7_SERVB|nr:hypothetical protein M408DRAFT_325778 [Serendipita vermifera MAFF 305830]
MHRLFDIPSLCSQLHSRVGEYKETKLTAFYPEYTEFIGPPVFRSKPLITTTNQ